MLKINHFDMPADNVPIPVMATVPDTVINRFATVERSVVAALAIVPESAICLTTA